MDRVGDVVEFACTSCGLQGVTTVEQLRRKASTQSPATGGIGLKCPKCGRPLKLFHEVQTPVLVNS